MIKFSRFQLANAKPYRLVSGVLAVLLFIPCTLVYAQPSVDLTEQAFPVIEATNETLQERQLRPIELPEISLNTKDERLKQQWDRLYEQMAELGLKCKQAQVSDTQVSESELQEGINIANQALKLVEQTNAFSDFSTKNHNKLPNNQLAISASYEYLSLFYFMLDDPENRNLKTAIDYTHKTLDILKTELGDDHYYVGAMTLWLAKQYYVLEDYQNAGINGVNAFVIQRKYLAYGDDTLFQTMDLSTRAFEKMDKANLMAPLYHLLIDYHGDKFQPNDPQYSKWVNNLAEAYRHDEQFDKAIQLHSQNLLIRTQFLGSTHPQTLISAGNLAIAYAENGEFDKAIKLNLQTLKAREQTLGDNHPQTLSTVSNLAYTYANNGDYDKAIALFERAISSNMQVAHEFDSEVITNQYELAYTYLRMQDYHNAKKYLQIVETNTQKILDSVEQSKQRHILPSWVSLYRDLSRAMLANIKSK